MIVYNDIEHTYTYHENEKEYKEHPENGVRYTSVTQLIGQYKPDMDWGQIAEKYVAKRTDEEILKDLRTKWNTTSDYGLTEEEAILKFGTSFTVEKVRDIWKMKGTMATTGGSNWHNWKELQDALLPDSVFLPMFDGIKVAEDLKDIIPNRTYLEMIIYNHKAKIAGQGDKPVMKQNTSVIRDYKCVNKELTPKVDKFWDVKLKRAVAKSFKYPLNKLKYNSYWEYALQLSLYGYMLELYGYPPERLVVDQVITKWIPMDMVTNERVIDIDHQLNKARVVTELKEVELPYLKKEAKALLNHKR